MTIEDLLLEKQKHEKVVNQTGLCRLLSLLFSLICLIAAIKEQNGILYVLSSLFFVFLLYFMHRQHQASEHLKRVKVHLDIKQKILDRQSGKWHGEGMHNEGNYYLSDLDVVGKDSLYHYLDFSYHESSQKRLMERLCQPLSSQEEIETMQGVFKDLKDKALDYLIEEGTLTKKERISLKNEDVMPIQKMPIYLKIVTCVYPVILLMSFFHMPIALYWMLFGVVFSNLHFRLFGQGYALTSRKVEVMQCFNGLISILSKERFESAWLIAFQKNLLQLNRQKKHLQMIDQLLKFRYNPLLMLILNAICFYDGWLYIFLERMQDDKYLLEIQEKLADYSALCSMSMWLWVKEDTIFPKISTHIKATNLKHPLMQSAKAVGADFDFESGAVIITGSNMAGKTTFMRSLGLNLVLFYCGLSVDATCFEAPILDIYTSMRVADRTQEGISTFYGELLRIKGMVESAKTKQPAIYLIDEIFKGTNLKDRIIGAKATIEKLTYPHSFLFVSTHDEALCEHEHVSITNIHFEESYVDNQVVFDYKLKMGVAKTTNAQFLMKMIGLLE